MIPPEAHVAIDGRVPGASFYVTVEDEDGELREVTAGRFGNLPAELFGLGMAKFLSENGAKVWILFSEKDLRQLPYDIVFRAERHPFLES